MIHGTVIAYQRYTVSMISKIVEATNDNQNWGKFMVLQCDEEWERRSAIDTTSRTPLLQSIGFTPEHIWVLDLQTGEGAWFRPGGIARCDLNKHKIWVCPLYEPFLTWLYGQDLRDLTKLPDMVNLPDAVFDFYGYRRAGLDEEEAQRLEEEVRSARFQEAENRREFLAGLDPKTREYATRMFADLGMTQEA